MIEPGRTLVRKRTESPPEGRRCPHRRQTRAMQFSAGSKPKSIIDIYRIVAITSIAGAAVHGLSMIDGTVHSLYDGRLRTGGRSPRAGTPSILWATDRTVRLRHGRRARPPRTTARPRRALRRPALATGAAAFPSCCRRRRRTFARRSVFFLLLLLGPTGEGFMFLHRTTRSFMAPTAMRPTPADAASSLPQAHATLASPGSGHVGTKRAADDGKPQPAKAAKLTGACKDLSRSSCSPVAPRASGSGVIRSPRPLGTIQLAAPDTPPSEPVAPPPPPVPLPALMPPAKSLAASSSVSEDIGRSVELTELGIDPEAPHAAPRGKAKAELLARKAGDPKASASKANTDKTRKAKPSVPVPGLRLRKPGELWAPFPADRNLTQFSLGLAEQPRLNSWRKGIEGGADAVEAWPYNYMPACFHDNLRPAKLEVLAHVKQTGGRVKQTVVEMQCPYEDYEGDLECLTVQITQFVTSRSPRLVLCGGGDDWGSTKFDAPAVAPTKASAGAPSKMKVGDLRAALQARGLDTSGLKATLADRLSAALASAASAPTVPAAATGGSDESGAEDAGSGGDVTMAEAEAAGSQVVAEVSPVSATPIGTLRYEDFQSDCERLADGECGQQITGSGCKSCRSPVDQEKLQTVVLGREADYANKGADVICVIPFCLASCEAWSHLCKQRRVISLHELRLLHPMQMVPVKRRATAKLSYDPMVASSNVYNGMYAVAISHELHGLDKDDLKTYTTAFLKGLNGDGVGGLAALLDALGEARRRSIEALAREWYEQARQHKLWSDGESSILLPLDHVASGKPVSEEDMKALASLAGRVDGLNAQRVLRIWLQRLQLPTEGRISCSASGSISWGAMVQGQVRVTARKLLAQYLADHADDDRLDEETLQPTGFRWGTLASYRLLEANASLFHACGSDCDGAFHEALPSLPPEAITGDRTLPEVTFCCIHPLRASLLQLIAAQHDPSAGGRAGG